MRSMRLPYYKPWTCRCGMVLSRLRVTISPQATCPNYNKPSSREGILNKALFRAAVSLPPASAKSGLPPPLPPTMGCQRLHQLASMDFSRQIFGYAGDKATFPFSGMPNATTPDPSFCRRLSTSCLSPSRSTFCTSAAITLIPLTTARALQARQSGSAPLYAFGPPAPFQAVWQSGRASRPGPGWRLHQH